MRVYTNPSVSFRQPNSQKNTRKLAADTKTKREVRMSLRKGRQSPKLELEGRRA